MNMKINAQSDTEAKYKTLTGSKIWIEGTSTINDFTCSTTQVVGYGYLAKRSVPADNYQNNSVKDSEEVVITINVRSFDCGRTAMNHDMYHAMKSDRFPVIRYRLVSAKLLSDPDSVGSTFTIDSKGKMTIAGKTNIVKIKMKVQQLQKGEFKLTGSEPISMHDYGITPPTALWGLIRAHDKLVVHFDLMAKVDKNGNANRLSETVYNSLEH